MSYILDALKKAEQQRHMGRVPGIGSEHDAPMSARRPWLWIGVLMINAGVLAALWHGRSAEPEMQPAVRSAPQAPAPAVPDRGEAPEPEMESMNFEAPARRAPPAPVTHAEPQQPLPVREVPRPQAPVERLPQSTHRPGGGMDASSLPVWPQIPSHLFQQLNATLNLDVHVYSEQSSGRFVLINLRKYREGESLQEGPMLEAIIPEGVILSYRGERFQVLRQ